MALDHGNFGIFRSMGDAGFGSFRKLGAPYFGVLVVRIT